IAKADLDAEHLAEVADHRFEPLRDERDLAEPHVLLTLHHRRRERPDAHAHEMNRSGVSSQKSCAYSGERSVFLARRADAGISGIFQGGATPPGTPRAGGIGTGLLRRDTRWLSCRRRAAFTLVGTRAAAAKRALDDDAAD